MKILLLLLLLLGIGGTAAGAEPFPGYLPERVMRREKMLELRGSGVLEGAGAPKFGVGFYIEGTALQAPPLTPGPVKQVVLNALAPVSQEILRSWFQGLLDASGAPPRERDQFLESVSGLEEGQQIIVTAYAEAIDVTVNAGRKVVVHGLAFQRAFLASFLGDTAVSPTLRAALLPPVVADTH